MISEASRGWPRRGAARLFSLAVVLMIGGLWAGVEGPALWAQPVAVSLEPASAELASPESVIEEADPSEANSSEAVEAPLDPSIAAATADAERVRSALEETGARTQLEETSWDGYLAHLLQSFAIWLRDGLRHLFNDIPISPEGMRRVLWAFVWIAAAGLVFLLVRALLRRRRAGGQEPEREVVEDLEEVAVRRTTAAVWRREMEAHLAAGRGRAALGALWWWLAETVAPGRADASWTSRQLLRHTRRSHLRPSLAQLDGLLYGSSEPAPDTVRAVDRQLRDKAS